MPINPLRHRDTLQTAINSLGRLSASYAAIPGDMPRDALRLIIDRLADDRTAALGALAALRSEMTDAEISSLLGSIILPAPTDISGTEAALAALTQAVVDAYGAMVAGGVQVWSFDPANPPHVQLSWTVAERAALTTAFGGLAAALGTLTTS